MEEQGISKKDLVIAVTSSDETNVLICLTAKKLGCPRAAARVRNPDYAGQIDFLKEGLEIDFITNPELDTAMDVARYLLRGYSSHLESFAGGRVGLFEVQGPGSAWKWWAGPWQKWRFWKRCWVGAIYRSGEVIIPSGLTAWRTMMCCTLSDAAKAVTALIRGILPLVSGTWLSG